MHIKKLLSEDGIKMNQGIIKKQKDYERSTWWLPKDDPGSSQNKMAHWVKLSDIRYGRKQTVRPMCQTKDDHESMVDKDGGNNSMENQDDREGKLISTEQATEPA